MSRITQSPPHAKVEISLSTGQGDPFIMKIRGREELVKHSCLKKITDQIQQLFKQRVIKQYPVRTI